MRSLPIAQNYQISFYNLGLLATATLIEKLNGNCNYYNIINKIVANNQPQKIFFLNQNQNYQLAINELITNFNQSSCEIATISREVKIAMACSIAETIKSIISIKTTEKSQNFYNKNSFFTRIKEIEYWQYWLTINWNQLITTETIFFAIIKSNLYQAENFLMIATQNQFDFFLNQLISKFYHKIIYLYRHQPLSQIIGYRQFYQEYFAINQDVLDPRPDSEILISTIINYFNSRHITTSPRLALDLATGSGCLAITLAKNLPYKIKIIASDLNIKALQLCGQNINNHQLKHQIIKRKSYIFKNISSKNLLAISSQQKSCYNQIDRQIFDFIVSNPPYIESKDILQLDQNVRNYEPRIALDGGYNGLVFYKILAREAKYYLKPNAPLFLEIGWNQKSAIIKLFQQEKWQLITAKKDLSNQDRVLVFNHKYQNNQLYLKR